MKKKILIAVLILLSLTALFYLAMPILHNTTNVDMSEHQHGEDSIYTCPMHPEIHQNEPGICPICHMKLVKVKQDKEDAGMASTKESQSLKISPYQADIIGLHPISVNRKNIKYEVPVSGRMLSSQSVAMQVFERDLRYIKNGVHFKGRSEAYPEILIEGTIVSVDSFADPSSRTIRVIGRVNKNLGRSLPESSFSGQIIVELGEQLVIPEQSVLFTGEGSFVYAYEDDKLTPRKVQLGPKVNEEYVVLDGIVEMDSISSGPNFLIDSEAKIRGLKGGLHDQKHH